MTRRLVSGARRLVVGARRHARRLATPLGPVEVLPFPQAPLAINVKIFVDSSWIDITPWVYGQERAKIEITRGKPNEAGQVDPSRATFQLNNRDGQFSPRNPTSWLYGKIGRNTQVRIAIGSDVRFHGEISEWPPRWDITGADIYIPIEASGILRRLTQGASPVKSAMYKGVTSLAIPPLAYWPCEDEEGATEIASGIGGPPMSLVGTPEFASSTVFECSAPLPLLSQSEWTGAIPSYAGGIAQVLLLVAVPTGGAIDDQGLFRLHMTGGTLKYVDLMYHTGGDLELRIINNTDTEVLSTIHNTNINGKLVRVQATMVISGVLQFDWRLRVLEVNGTAFNSTGTINSEDLGRASAVVINPGSDLDDIAVGHVSVHEVIGEQDPLQEELDAYSGETAGRRIERLCEEEGVDFRGIGDLDASDAMGPQGVTTLIDLLREVEETDQGILYEPRDMLGLAYRTRESMYNQTPVLTLDYSANDLSAIEPTEDDQNTRNDITLKRANGSFYRAIKETGPLSILPPPNGVGRYDEEITCNHEHDGMLPDHANWRLHLGTVDELRYPMLSINLARANFIGANVDQATKARILDVGDRLVVENPPSWVPPGDITQLTLGFAETLAQFTHTIDINCAPESPWGMVGTYDSVGSEAPRYSSDGSTLVAGIDSTATSLSVATPFGPLWTSADAPFDIKIGGEVMTINGAGDITGASSPQTFTVIRSVNGVVKSHLAGAEVELAHPAVYAI